MDEPWFTRVLERGLGAGLIAAALVDRHGNVVALAGEIAEDEAMPLAALVMYRLKSDDLAARLFTGEVVSLALEDREVAVGIAKRQLFVVAVLAVSTPVTQDRARELRDRIEGLLMDPGGEAQPLIWSGGGGGGSGSGPAELPLIELGITVPRTRGKA